MIPKEVDKNNRSTIYFDESGISSLNDSGRFFVLTGVIANNSDFNQLTEYYFRLKLKYFGEEKSVHSVELFWKPDLQTQMFILELHKYLETIPFGFITIVVDKNKIRQQAPLVTINNPYQTSFAKAKSIWIKKGYPIQQFESKTVREVLNEIYIYKIYDINKYYPLISSYKKLLYEYISNYSRSMNTDRYDFEICFETSPNRERILKYTEEFFNEQIEGSQKEKTSFAKSLKEKVYSISFPNKSAKYLGLEIADMISYGFSLSRNKRLNEVTHFKPIWETINKRRLELRREYNVQCVLHITK